ncbi:MAG: copper-binding protein [Betaproteobacteria bacterium]|nr:copper-binding protein [Betaproteobacteria bacterium]
MKSLFIVTIAAFTLATGHVNAQEKPTGKPEMTDAEVRKIDKDAGKITLKHGEIKNLEMPAMTMVFQVKDAALLDKVKAGDKVKFAAEKSRSGYAVTTIEVSK